MAVIIFDAPTYSDVAYVEGVARHDERMERALYQHCRQYYDNNYKGEFIVSDDKKDVFQEAYITFWNIIRNKKIYVEDGVVKGKNNVPLTGKLTSFFFGIAIKKNKEWCRKNGHIILIDKITVDSENIVEDEALIDSLLYEDEYNKKLELIADCLSLLPRGCNQIITMFYLELKTLDEILKEMTTYSSKNALKTAKNKCMNRLKKAVGPIYDRYFND